MMLHLLAGAALLVAAPPQGPAQPALAPTPTLAMGARLRPTDFQTSTPAVSSIEAARRAGTLTPPPSHAELKSLWETGTWSQDIGRAGTFLSGFKDFLEYSDLSKVAPNPIPLKPGPAAVERHIREEMAKGRQIFGPYGVCHPSGMPYILTMSGYGGYQVIVADDELHFVYGNQRELRRIYIDGRPHPDEATTTPLYNGFSSAHWEGKTMVVETTNIRGSNTQIEPYVPKSEGSYVVERYTPVGPGEFVLEMTMLSQDFTRPWVVKLKLTRDPTGKLVEGLCSDDNRWSYGKDGELVLNGPDGKTLEKAED